jgi:predicted TIM-barrel fold metal-dependent hydrolase
MHTLRLLIACLTATLFQPVAAAARFETKTIIDMHIHVAGVGAGNSGCYLSPDLGGGYKFDWYLQAFGVDASELERHGDAILITRLANQIAQSRTIDKGVVLALDGVVDANGELDYARTQLYVPNDFVRAETAKFDNLLFGASVNPYRADALSVLENVVAQGAVLIKWIPATMLIDPADPAIVPFYERLAALGVPLLVHVGRERALANARDEFGDPKRLHLPLQTGVTVIAAHLAGTGKNEGEDNFERLLPMFARYPNLYTDISSLTQINKFRFLYRGLRYPEVRSRMIYGSDFPIESFPLVSPWYQLGRVPLDRLYAIANEPNRWDRDVELKRAMGVPDDVFVRAWTLLGID